MGPKDAGRGGPMPMFPLSSVLFPHAPLTLHVFEPRYRQLTADCLAGDRQLGIVLITRGSEVGGNDQRSNVGTVARIEDAAPMPDGRWFLLLAGRRRVQVSEWLVDDPYPRAFVEDLVDEAATSGGSAGSATGDGHDPRVLRALAAIRHARGLLSEAGRGPLLRVEPGDLAPDPTDAAWQLCHLAPVGPLDRQRLLESRSLSSRLELVTRLSAELAEDVQRMLAGG